MAAGHLGVIWASVGLDTVPLGAGVARARRLMYAMDATMTQAAGGTTGTMAAASQKLGKAFSFIARTSVIAGTIVAAASVKMASDFDSAIRKAGAVAEASEEEMADWGKTIIGMSKKLPESAVDIADALYWIKSDMPDATDAEQFETLNVAARGAVAGVADLADATEALIVVQNAYAGSGVELQGPIDYMDAMNVAVQRGSLTLQDFVANMGKATGTAALARVPFTELAAAAATLTRKGVPVETTFMALNQAMMTFIKPSKGALDTAKALGIEFSLASLRSKGLAGALLEIAQKVPDDKLAKLFPNIRALKAVLPLAGVSTKDFTKDLEAMGMRAGTTNEMFSIASKSMANKMKVMMNRIKAPLIELGYKIFPYLEKAVAGLADIIEGKNETFNKIVGTIKAMVTPIYNLGKAFFSSKAGVTAFFGALAGYATFIVVVGSIQKLINVFNRLKTVALNVAAGLSNVWANISTGFVVSGTSLGGTVASAAGLATSLSTIALAVAPIAIPMGLWIKSMIDADAAMEELQKTGIAFDKELGREAASAEPLVKQLSELEMKLNTLNPETQEYVDTHKKLLDVQNKLSSVYPGLFRGMESIGNITKINIQAALDEIQIRKKLAEAGAPETRTLTKHAAALVTSKNNYKRLYDQVSDYDSNIEMLTSDLDKMGMTEEGVNRVAQAFYESANKGKKILKSVWQQEKATMDLRKEGYLLGERAGTPRGMEPEEYWTEEYTENYANRIIKAENKVKTERIKNAGQARTAMLKYFEDYTIALEQMRVTAKQAGAERAGVPAELISTLAPQVKDAGIKASAQASADLYIKEYFASTFKGAQEQLPIWATSMRNLLTSGQFTEAYNQSAMHGSNTFVTSWVAQMAANQTQVAAATGKIPKILTQALTNEIPAIRQAAAAESVALIATLASNMKGMEDEGLNIAYQLADGIAKGHIVPGALSKEGQEAMVALAKQLGVTQYLDPVLAGIEKKVSSIRVKEAMAKALSGVSEMLSGIFGTKEEKQIALTISDGGSGAATSKSLQQVEDKANELDGIDPEVVTTANTAQANAAFARLMNRLQAVNGKTVATVYIQALVRGSGPFTADQYVSYMTGKLNQISGTATLNVQVVGGVGGAAGGATTSGMADALTALNTAWANMNATVMGGWNLGMINKEFADMESAIQAVTMEITGQNAEIAGQTLANWRALRGALDAANAKMKETEAAIQASDDKIAAWQHRLDVIQSSVTGWRDANGKMHQSLDVLNAKMQKSNDTMSKQQAILSKMQQMKLKGETARSDKSFALQQSINKEQLKILKYEEKVRKGTITAKEYEAMVTAQLKKEELEKQKEIYDLQTSVTYDPQRRQIEKMLDPLKGQEMTLAHIKKHIREAQVRIAQEERLQRKLNKEIAIAEKEHKRISQLITQEQHNTWKMRTEYQRIIDKVRELQTAIDEMARNAVQRWQEIQRAIEAANKEAAKAGSGGGAPQPGGVSGAAPHAAGYGAVVTVSPVTKVAPVMISEGDVNVEVPVFLDGKQIASSTTRVTGNKASLYSRSGGKY